MQDRGNTVQTFSQYQFIHRVLQRHMQGTLLEDEPEEASKPKSRRQDSEESIELYVNTKKTHHRMSEQTDEDAEENLYVNIPRTPKAAAEPAEPKTPSPQKLPDAATPVSSQKVLEVVRKMSTPQSKPEPTPVSARSARRGSEMASQVGCAK